MRRHPLHSICPYFAMFPEDYVRRELKRSARPGPVFDPFAGRATTIFESLLSGIPAAGTDPNPVAACIGGAKCDAPMLSSINARIRALRLEFSVCGADTPRLEADEFFASCYHPATLRQIQFLRLRLRWRVSRVDRFIAAVALGCLHGESHKTRNCLSNRMPRTISTKPAYSIRWWRQRGLTAPARDAFDIIERMAGFRLAGGQPALRGRVAEVDARLAARAFPRLRGRVTTVITSPPYLDTTSYREDQWLRCWFLNGGAAPSVATGDRHRSGPVYWSFLTECWGGLAPLLARDAWVSVRIGAGGLGRGQIAGLLAASLRTGLDRRVEMLGSSTSTLRRGQRRSFRPGAKGLRTEHDFRFRVE